MYSWNCLLRKVKYNTKSVQGQEDQKIKRFFTNPRTQGDRIVRSIVDTFYLARWNTKQEVYNDEDQKIKRFFTNTRSQSDGIVMYINIDETVCYTKNVQ